MCVSEKDECNKKGETDVNENEAKKLKQRKQTANLSYFDRFLLN